MSTLAKIIIGLLAAIIVFAVLMYIFADKTTEPPVQSTLPPVQSSNPSAAPTPNPEATNGSAAFNFDNPKKSAHYVSNEPAHGASLDAAPGKVSLTFNFGLANNSTISVTNNGQEYSDAAAVISGDKLAMTKLLKANAPGGLYTVKYTACWPDTTCHDGQFQFAVK